MNKLMRPLLFIVLMGILLAGCGSEDTAPQQPPAVQEAPATEVEVAPTESQVEDTPLIIFRRTGGFAGLEEEWWLFADGRIINQRDNQVQQVAAEDIVTLHREMVEGGFMTLPASYLPEDTCCDRFIYEVTVIEGDSRHTVTTMDDTDNIPSLIRESLVNITMLLVSQRE